MDVALCLESRADMWAVAVRAAVGGASVLFAARQIKAACRRDHRWPVGSLMKSTGRGEPRQTAARPAASGPCPAATPQLYPPAGTDP